MTSEVSPDMEWKNQPPAKMPDYIENWSNTVQEFKQKLTVTITGQKITDI